jgi:hypothetical protein
MQPQIEGTAPSDGKHVLLIDRSGSMTSVGKDGATRLEEAKEKAIDYVDQLYGGGLFSSSGGETMIIAFSDYAEVITPFTDSKQQLISSIRSIAPTHGKSQIGESLQLARAYMTNIDPENEGVSSSDSAHLELFSDGLIVDINNQVLARGETLSYQMVGSSEDTNIGIATIDAKRPSESVEEVQVFISLVNTSDNSATVDIELSIDSIPVGVQEVIIPPQLDGLPGKASMVFVPFLMPKSGVIQATILADDILEIDNRAALVVPPSKELRVILVEDGAPILQSVLEGMPLQELKVVHETTLEKMIQDGKTAEYDVVVTRDITLENMPRGNYFMFGSPPPVEALQSFVSGDAQVMLVADEEHPCMRFVRYEDIVVTEGYEVVFDGSVQVLLEGSNWPAVMNYRGSGTQLVYVSFDPMDSNWPYLRSFPFFVFNTVEYLGRSGSQFTSSVKLVGDSISELVQLGDVVQIIDPEGVSHPVSVDSNGVAVWGPVRLAGVHTMEIGDSKEVAYAINASSLESEVASVETVTFGTKKVQSAKSDGASYIQLWPWALGAVLAVLLAEWWVYQKKVSHPLVKTWTHTGGNS